MLNENPRRYFALLFAQTICAIVILYHVQATFRLLIENIGTLNATSTGSMTQLLIAAVVSQALYWWRQRTVPVPAIWKNVVAGHLIAFASRIGFIFGGALFSLYFLRHAPNLGLGYLDLAWRGGLLIAILFALYCYLLELERLGNALQDRRKPSRPANPDEASL